MIQFAPPIILPANALLLGTDANGAPIAINVGTGLSLVNGVLVLTGAVTQGNLSDSAGNLLADDAGGHLLLVL